MEQENASVSSLAEKLKTSLKSTRYLGLYSYSIYEIHDFLVSMFWDIIKASLRIPNNVIDVIDWLSIIGYRWLLCASVWLLLLII